MNFIETTLKLLTCIRNGFDSQICESFNAIKTRYVSKTFSWKISWKARIACAIGQVNMPSMWRHQVAAACGLAPMHPQASRRLEAEADRVAKLNVDPPSAAKHEKERNHRQNERNADARRRLGQRDYRGSASSTGVRTEMRARTAKTRRITRFSTFISGRR
jgi:hypothetical protein